jgi:DNA-binding transcriptional regulator LsrR (DeoR family)
MKGINQSNLPVHLGELQGKDTKNDQLKKVFQSFFDSPKTMKEVDKDCGVMRENICRYVGALRKNNQIWILRKRRCKVTGWYASELTTNPKLAPTDKPLTLF